ncbi:tryptophan synthase beta subunit-like PLP-dependent enzyme [Syncephalis plumigaleata]|nr:tryptophan synthase beta subunit-like PLP-dependent enzyme [Syncephalis plumigaleata]
MMGNTPIVTIPLNELKEDNLLRAKLEYRNPTGSIKDRVADWLLNTYRSKGKLEGKQTLVVPTTGNLAIALAARASQFGIRVIAVIPESTSYDRIHLLKAQGVEIIRTPNVRRDSDESCFAVARRIASSMPNALLVDETAQSFLPHDIYHTMSQEIIATCLEIDAVFIGVESGGTINGLSALLKVKYPNIKIIGVLPEGATVSQNDNNSNNIVQRTWMIEDIGTELATPHITQTNVDQWIHISDQEAYSTTRELIRQFGVLCGPSGGAVVAAARQYHQSNETHKLLVIINDSATYYPTTLLNDEWLMKHDLAGTALLREIQHQALEKYRGASVEDLQLSAAVTVRETTSLMDTLDQMTEREFSQLPVLDEHRKMIGFVYDADLRAILESNAMAATDPVKQWMHRFTGGRRRHYQVITPDTPLADLAQFFERHSAAFRRWCLGRGQGL